MCFSDKICLSARCNLYSFFFFLRIVIVIFIVATPVEGNTKMLPGLVLSLSI